MEKTNSSKGTEKKIEKTSGKDKMSNVMRNIKVTKVTLNIGTGKDQVLLEKAQKLLKQITGIAPVRTITQKRIAAWGLRPGLPIGCKLTLRGQSALDILPRMLTAKEFKLNDENFDDNGNVSFGIKEYIDIRDAKYDPEIGIMGLQCSITLERPGFRIKRRKLLKKSIPLHHRISKEDAMVFMKQNFDVKYASEDEDDD
jgi:large subunit ribosomal protein L5